MQFFVKLDIFCLATFLLQQALHEVESSSTFRNECGNAATDFWSIAPLATCLAMFCAISQ